MQAPDRTHDHSDAVGEASPADIGSGEDGRVPTQKDVARLAGVSPITVSRTLAGGKHVRPDLQRRVIDAVRALDYLPNENARGLRPGQQSGLIGVVITNLNNPYFGTFAMGVEEVARERGKFILLGSTAESAARETEMIDHFLSRRVEGIILVPAGEPAPRRWMRRLGEVPIVAAARELDDLRVDTVIVDDTENAREATAQLIAEGHRRIAFVGNIVTVSAHRMRYEGYVAALQEAGIPVDERLVRGVNDEVVDARADVHAFLDAPHPPTAMLAVNNRIATGALLALAERRRAGAVNFPIVVAFDQLELAELLVTPVRVFEHDPREVGRAAARLLFDRLDGLGGDPRRQAITGRRTAEAPV